jgi:hypothetical protein
MKYDVSKAQLLDTMCDKHGSNTWLLENGDVVCANDHLVREFQAHPQCTVCGVHYKLVEGHKDCKGEAWHKFHTAKYYTADDSCETLSVESYEEVIDQLIDNCWPGFDAKNPSFKPKIEDVIDDACPIKLYAYVPSVLDKGFAEGMVDKFVDELQTADCMAEVWWEEYGDIDGNHPPLGEASPEQITELQAKLSEVLHPYLLKYSHMWRCHVVDEKEFEYDEVLAIIKDFNPDLFTKENQ